MKFTILSHAGLHVETKDCSILIDPWLVGSCYWRSWWNYPPPPGDLVRKLRPDYIYLTHLHWDHFHSPSLRRFDPQTRILVPRGHFPRMVEDLDAVGLQNVEELTHGVRRRLGGQTSVVSYQFGVSLDSALLIDDGEAVLFNANDCKLMGGPLRHIVRKHARIDFVFKSHSSASPYPFCVSSEFPEHLTYRSNDDYAREFLAFAELVNARYAVPFASNHCFLHRETKQFNETVVSPCDVKAYFDVHRKKDATCQVMIPGDYWSSEEGFSLTDHDYFTDRQRHLRELEDTHAEKLRTFYEREDKVQPHWESFRRYFEKLLASLPPGSGRLLPARIHFHVKGSPPADWLVDFRLKTVLDRLDPSSQVDIRLDVHPSVLRDCCQKRMFSVFTASKRVQYHLKTRPALRYFMMFNMLMDMYESEYFPLHLMLRRRFLSNWLRRWREVLFYLSALASMGIRRAAFRPLDHLTERA